MASGPPFVPFVHARRAKEGGAGHGWSADTLCFLRFPRSLSPILVRGGRGGQLGWDEMLESAMDRLLDGIKQLSCQRPSKYKYMGTIFCLGSRKLYQQESGDPLLAMTGSDLPDPSTWASSDQEDPERIVGITLPPRGRLFRHWAGAAACPRAKPCRSCGVPCRARGCDGGRRLGVQDILPLDLS